MSVKLSYLFFFARFCILKLLETLLFLLSCCQWTVVLICSTIYCLFYVIFWGVFPFLIKLFLIFILSLAISDLLLLLSLSYFFSHYPLFFHRYFMSPVVRHHQQVWVSDWNTTKSRHPVLVWQCPFCFSDEACFPRAVKTLRCQFNAMHHSSILQHQ